MVFFILALCTLPAAGGFLAALWVAHRAEMPRASWIWWRLALTSILAAVIIGAMGVLVWVMARP